MSRITGHLVHDVKYGDTLTIETPEGPVVVEPRKRSGEKVRLSIRAPKTLEIRPCPAAPTTTTNPIVDAATTIYGGEGE